MPFRTGLPRCLFFLLLLTNQSLHAQSIPNLAATRETLLSDFVALQKMNVRQYTAGACMFDSTQTLSALLAQAHRLDLDGKAACVSNLLQWLKQHRVPTAKDELARAILQADFLNTHQRYDSAKAIARQALEWAASQKDFSGQVAALLTLSSGALKRREISNAYLYADSALILARQNGYRLLEGKALLQMALVARRHFTSSAHRAFPYYLQSIEVAEANNDSSTLFTSYLYYAVDNFEIGNWTEGLPYFQKAVAIATTGHNVYQQYTACIGTGYTLQQLGFTQEPVILFHIALDISQQQQLPYNIQHSFFELAGVYEQAKQYDSALYYADRAATVAGVDSFWADMWKVKAGIYQKMGNYKMAAMMYEKAMKWANEDFLYRNQDQLSAFEAKLKTTEKELEAARERRRRIQLEWSIGVSVFLLLLAAAGFVWQRRARQMLSAQNALIEKQRLELAGSLAEKEILLKEIHHRVKNNLSVIGSLLELQAMGIVAPEAKAAIVEAQNRVRSIALIHQQLYRDEHTATINVNGFASELSRQLFAIFQTGSKKITTNIDIPVILLDIDTAVPLGLIMNELLTNSYKYAFNTGKPGTIYMFLSRLRPGHFEFQYSDSGPGLPPHVDPQQGSSMGLRMIYRLSQQIGGSARYEAGEPSRFIIYFTDSNTRNQEHG